MQVLRIVCDLLYMFSGDIATRRHDFASLVMMIDDDLAEKMSQALVDTVFTSNANTTENANGMCVRVLLLL
jgi:hypothetical protein